MIIGTEFKIPAEHVDFKLLQQVIDEKGGDCSAEELIRGSSGIQGYYCCDYCVGYLQRVRTVKP